MVQIYPNRGGRGGMRFFASQTHTLIFSQRFCYVLLFDTITHIRTQRMGFRIVRCKTEVLPSAAPTRLGSIRIIFIRGRAYRLFGRLNVLQNWSRTIIHQMP